jgi:outer membrane receptor for ferrienterochelin and colicins
VRQTVLRAQNQAILAFLVVAGGVHAADEAPPEPTVETAPPDATSEAPADPQPTPGGPPVPDGAVEGEIVEVDGVLYEVRDGVLVTLEEAAATAPPPKDDEVPPSPFSDEKRVVVTGSRVDTRTDATVVRTEVIDSETIRDRGATTLADVLQQQQGVQVNSSLGTGEQVSMDGLDGKYVLILVDGRPVNGRTNDRIDISRLPVTPNNIERVEIVRGPMSALYGSEAIGGVINIVTKRPQPGIGGYVETGMIMPRGGLYQGTLDTGVSGSGGPFTFRLGLTTRVNDAYDRATKVTTLNEPGSGPPPSAVVDIPDGKSDLPYRRQATLTGEVGIFLTDTWQAQVYTTSSMNEVTTKLVSGLPFRDNTLITDTSLGTQLQGDILPGHQVTMDVRIARYTHLFGKLPDGGDENPPAFCQSSTDGFGLHMVDPACPADRAVRTDSRQDQSMLELRYSGELLRGVTAFDELNLSTGMVIFNEHFVRKDGEGEDTIPGGASLYRGALYGEVLWRPFSWLSFIPGVRGDGFMPGSGNDAIGTALGPKISSRLDLPWGFALRGSYGQGFRLPSFQERFLRFDHSELGYIVEGNDALRPETSRGGRAEVLWAWPQLMSLSLEGYVNLLDDMILPRSKPGEPLDPATGIPIFSYENIARAYTAGAHLQATLVEFWGFAGDMGYTYVFNAVDASRCPDENPYFCSSDEGAISLPLVPQHNFHVGGRYRIRATDTSLSGHVEYMSFRPVSETSTAPEFIMAGVGIRQAILDHAEVNLRAENLLDMYDPVYGPKPGLNVRLNVRAWF